MFFVVEGPPGSGKTFLVEKLSASNKNSCVFHVPDILKPDGRFRDILSVSEKKFVDSNWNNTDVDYRYCGIVDFSSANMNLTDIILRVLTELNRKFDVVFLDAFPRTVKQANAFISFAFAHESEVYLAIIDCGENEREFSIVRQVLRQQKESERINFPNLGKFIKKTTTYIEETKPCIALLKETFPYAVCKVDVFGGVLSPKDLLIY